VVNPRRCLDGRLGSSPQKAKPAGYRVGAGEDPASKPEEEGESKKKPTILRELHESERT
jgi:hypothetical protein